MHGTYTVESTFRRQQVRCAATGLCVDKDHGHRLGMLPQVLRLPVATHAVAAIGMRYRDRRFVRQNQTVKRDRRGYVSALAYGFD